MFARWRGPDVLEDEEYRTRFGSRVITISNVEDVVAAMHKGFDDVRMHRYESDTHSGIDRPSCQPWSTPLIMIYYRSKSPATSMRPRSRCCV